MKDRTLVFYKKKDVGVSSTFKVIIVSKFPAREPFC
jgi:hypothetical protein